MTPERWRLVTDVFHAARERDPAGRAAYLGDVCANDADLRAQVEALLAADGQAGSFGAAPPIPAAHDRLTPGALFGPYRITSFIGAGGMGEVYLAADVRLRRQVALKRLVARAVDTPELADRLLNEARAIAKLNHPNIAAVYDVFDAGGSTFIVMEYAPGETLATTVRRGLLPVARVVDISLQLLDALVAAHAAGILHRDLKPSNIHLTPAGKIKVLDFGIARIAAETAQASTEATRTATSLAGTPGYIAPEQLVGHPADQRSDIYAAGVILFQLATGRHPFEDSDALERMLSAVGRTPPRASDVQPAVPSLLSDVIARALSTSPAERYQTASDFKSALEDAAARLRGERPSHSIGVWARVSKAVEPLTRRRVSRLVSGVLVVAAVLMTGVLQWRSTPPPRLAAAARAPARATMAILPPQNRTGQRQLDEWPGLVQSLLAGELTGVPDVAVMDVMAVNDLLDAARTQSARNSSLDVLRRAQVTLVAEGDVISSDVGYRIETRVVDAVTGENQFAARTDVAAEAALPSAARTLATQVLSFLQVHILQTQDKDLRPWISYRDQNIEAVKAFAIANQYIYRRQSAEAEKFIRRAIELDPSFIAPKLWLLPRLIREQKTQEARQTFNALLALEPHASPLEQATIAYLDAKLKADQPAQIRALETALSYSPGNNILLVSLAYLRLAAGDCAAALKTMRPAVDVGWRYPPLYPFWAWCSVEVGQRQEAARGIDRTLEVTGGTDSPDTYGVLEAVAIAIGDASRTATCRSLYDMRKRQTGAAGTSPDVAYVYTRLGRSLLQLKSFNTAVALYRRALSEDSGVAMNHDGLATALEALGDVEGARKEYAASIALDPGLTHARERLEALGRERHMKGDQ